MMLCAVPEFGVRKRTGEGVVNTESRRLALAPGTRAMEQVGRTRGAGADDTSATFVDGGFPFGDGVQSVADATDRFQVCRPGGIKLQFLADAANAGIDAAWSDELSIAPDGIEQKITGKDLPTMPREVLNDAKLKAGNGHGFTVNEDFHRPAVDDQVSFPGSRSARQTAQDGLNSRDQFATAERLGDAIVSAGFKNQNTVLLCVLIEQKDDRQAPGGAGLAKMAAKRNAAAIRQHQ